MSKWKNRRLSEYDILDPFEIKYSHDHAYNALGVAGRLDDDGRQYFRDEPSIYDQWKKFCSELWFFINLLEAKIIKIDSNYKSQQTGELLTVLRESINGFEHAEHRIYQLLYSDSVAENHRFSLISHTRDRLNLYFRSVFPLKVHAGNSQRVIERLGDDGRLFFSESSSEYNRWEESCNELNRISTLESRYKYDNDNNFYRPGALFDIFREFIDMFERVEYNLYQLLQSESIVKYHRSPSITDKCNFWLPTYYRFAIYAIISTFIKDKTESRSLEIRLNLTTGEYSETWSAPPLPIKVPRRYRRMK